MFNRKRDRNRKLALAAVGLGLMALRGKRRFRRYAMWRLMSGGFGPGALGGLGRGAGRFGPWAQGADFTQMPIPPFIEARLKTWHDKAHGNQTAGSSAGQDVTQV